MGFGRDMLGTDRFGAVIEGQRVGDGEAYSWAAWKLNERTSGVAPSKLDALAAVSAFLDLDTDA